MNGQWITDWSRIVPGERYIVRPIHARPGDQSLYLGQPISDMPGWEVTRLMQGCYAALPCPPFAPGVKP